MGLTIAIPVDEFGNNAIPQRAPISVSAAGANEVVPAVDGTVIRVLAIALQGSGGANEVQIVSDDGNSGTTPIFGTFTVDSTSPFVLGETCLGWCDTLPGEALSLSLDSASDVTGGLIYVRFKAA